MIDPSHPEGQSPVQPTCDVCGDCGRTAGDSLDACFRARRILMGMHPIDSVDAGCLRITVARLRAELAQQKQFGLDRLAQHVEEEQAAHAEVATLRAENAALVAGAEQSALLHELSRKSDRAISEALLAAGAPTEGPFSERIKALGNKIARLLKAADDLCFECDGVIGTRAPSVATYNRAFGVISEMKKP